MARTEDGKPMGTDGFGPATALADKERRVSDMPLRKGGGDRPYEDSSGSTPTPPAASGGGRSGFFEIYKPSQGYHTRIWSGVAFFVMVSWLAYFLYEKLSLYGSGSNTKLLQVGVATAVILGMGLLDYWLFGLNRKMCDFLIATEGEMKKVNWTSRKEIIGSTKVVVFVVMFTGILLFVVDVFFMVFFNAIGILKGEGIMSALKSAFTGG